MKTLKLLILTIALSITSAFSSDLTYTVSLYKENALFKKYEDVYYYSATPSRMITFKILKGHKTFVYTGDFFVEQN